MFELINHEFVMHFFDSYTNNLREEKALRDSLLKPMDEVEFLGQIHLISNRRKVLFAENNQLIKELKSKLPSFPNDSISDALYELITKLYAEAIDDLAISELIIPKLIKYYELRRNTERLVLLYYIHAFISFKYYGNLGNEELIKIAVDDYQSVIKLSRKYEEIHDSKIRKFFFNAIDQLILHVSPVYPPLHKRIFNLYDAAMTLWNSSHVQALDGDDFSFIELTRKLRDDLLATCSYTEELSDEEQERFICIVNTYDEDSKNPMEYLYKAQIKKMILEEDFSPEKVILAIDEYLTKLPEISYSDENRIEYYCSFMNEHNSSLVAYDILSNYPVSDNTKQIFLEHHLLRILHHHLALPQSFPLALRAKLCEEYYLASAEFLASWEMKIRYLELMILQNDPLTFYHSCMVKEITGRIAQSMVAKHPDYFIGILQCKNIDDIQNRKEEMITYIELCALLHDLGKYQIKEIIGQLSRSLSSSEIELLKMHTTLSSKYIEKVPSLRPYHKMMLGHHKYYLDVGGYPEEYHHLENSDQKIIDMITIADALDAGTDQLLRCYKEPKQLSLLLVEMKVGKETVYHPDIVHLLFEDTTLTEDLIKITGENRATKYYQYYKNLRELYPEAL